MAKTGHSAVLVLLLSAAAACEQSPTVPVPATLALAGTVTVSAPSFTPLGGVTLTIVEGEAAGKSFTTNDKGEFAVETTAKGTITIRASREGYESQSLTTDLANAHNLRFTLKPLPSVVQVTLTPEMGVAGQCDRPCHLYALNIHNDGRITASVRWADMSHQLNLSLWRGDTRIAAGGRFNTLVMGFAEVPVVGGVSYQLRVDAGDRGFPPSFTVNISRPN